LDLPVKGEQLGTKAIQEFWQVMGMISKGKAEVRLR
jgi:hypothetical protein